VDVKAETAQERAELADLLDTLTPKQWEAQSLCARWRVRDVVAHMVSYEGVARSVLLRRLVEARVPTRLNEVGVAELADRAPGELVELLRTHLWPTGATAALGGKVGLVDGLIHHQDIRRPLGLPRTVPPERLRVALPFAVTAPPLRGFWHARGVRLVATDVDWTWGRGREVRGTGEALLMVLAGRRGVADELDGPGQPVIARRLG
jgi:uncharacterized protein (TIGR03083 family)